MSKKSKSKNSIVKKAKKFQRQGKFEKAIKLCDDYLDNEKLEESIIQIKVDNLSDLFYQKNLSEKFTRYTNELDYFLDAEEEKEFLKIYSIFEQLYKESEDFLRNAKALNAYLISGILIDPVESIIVMNGIIKKKGNEEKKDIPADLKEHIDSIRKVAYQYLGLYFDNPEEYVASLNIDTAAVFEKVMKTVPLEKEEAVENTIETAELENNEEAEIPEPEENTIKTSQLEENIKETEEEAEIPEPEENTIKTSQLEENIKETEEEAETDFKMIDSDQLSNENKERIESEIESLKKQVAEANAQNKFNKAYKLQERLIKASKSINPTGVEIRELKEEIKEANESGNYRKGLKLQKKLLKLSKNQDIIDPEKQEKSEQTTLFDDF